MQEIKERPSLKTILGRKCTTNKQGITFMLLAEPVFKPYSVPAITGTLGKRKET